MGGVGEMEGYMGSVLCMDFGEGNLVGMWDEEMKEEEEKMGKEKKEGK